VIDMVYNSRLGKPAVRALAPEAAANRPFHFWFSTASDLLTQGTAKREHFLKVEKKVVKLEGLSNGL
jgi:hypothetical protein